MELKALAPRVHAYSTLGCQACVIIGLAIASTDFDYPAPTLVWDFRTGARSLAGPHIEIAEAALSAVVICIANSQLDMTTRFRLPQAYIVHHHTG